MSILSYLWRTIKFQAQYVFLGVLDICDGLCLIVTLGFWYPRLAFYFSAWQLQDVMKGLHAELLKREAEQNDSKSP